MSTTAVATARSFRGRLTGPAGVARARARGPCSTQMTRRSIPELTTYGDTGPRRRPATRPALPAEPRAISTPRTSRLPVERRRHRSTGTAGVVPQCSQDVGIGTVGGAVGELLRVVAVVVQLAEATGVL